MFTGENETHVTVLDPRHSDSEDGHYRKYPKHVDPSLYVNAWIEVPHETYSVIDLIFGANT